jgi:hypothetical protein
MKLFSVKLFAAKLFSPKLFGGGTTTTVGSATVTLQVRHDATITLTGG